MNLDLYACGGTVEVAIQTFHVLGQREAMKMSQFRRNKKRRLPEYEGVVVTKLLIHSSICVLHSERNRRDTYFCDLIGKFLLEYYN
jgi:hypothetical protein